MRSLIVYYSYSGNTKKVAEQLCEHLRQKGQVDIIGLKAHDESESFFGQCRRAFTRQRAKIEPVNFDLSGYDLICFGSPVWAFAPAPAMNSYLDQVQNIQDKKVVLFTTFGSGTGNTRCLNYMQRILAEKGAKNFKRFSSQQSKVSDRDFVSAQIQATLSQ
jgi:flavodoxin